MNNLEIVVHLKVLVLKLCVFLFVLWFSVGSLAGQGGRSELLENYVRYVFDNAPNGTKFVFEALARVWLSLLEEATADAQKSLQFSWFFFDLIVKSATLYLNERHALSKSRRNNLMSLCN